MRSQLSRPTPQITRGGGLSAGAFVAIALVCGVVGAGGVFGFLALRSDPKVSDTIAAVTGRRIADGSAPEVVDDGQWSDADITFCTDQAAAAADAAAKRRLDALSADRLGAGAPETDFVRQSADLLCSATHKPLHLCQSYWHGQFVTAIQKYAKAFRQVSSESYWSMYTIAERAKSEGADSTTDWDSVTAGIRQTTADVAEMRKRIIAAFRDLIADGIISPSDFGKFLGIGIPTDIREMIGDAEPVRKACG